jgi:hypothetical protein
VRHRLQKARRTTQRVRSTPFILFLSFFTVSSSPPPRLCRHVIDDVTQVSDPPGSTFWARTARHVTHNTRATPSHRLRAGAARHVTHGTRATSSRSSPSWCHRAATGHQSTPLSTFQHQSRLTRHPRRRVAPPFSFPASLVPGAQPEAVPSPHLRVSEAELPDTPYTAQSRLPLVPCLPGAENAATG